MVIEKLINKNNELSTPNRKVICNSNNVLGNGSISNIKHIILVVKTIGNITF